MKMIKSLTSLLLFPLVFFFMLVTTEASGQKMAKPSVAIPDNLNKIFTNSCTPCHTDKGGMMSRSKLNFNDWTQYSLEKQREKATAIYSDLEKAKMPPKNARETRPGIIPTNEQIGLIKKWVDSLKTDDKK